MPCSRQLWIPPLINPCAGSLLVGLRSYEQLSSGHFFSAFVSLSVPSFERYVLKLRWQHSELEKTCYLAWSGHLPVRAPSLQLPSLIPDFLVLMAILEIWTESRLQSEIFIFATIWKLLLCLLA